MTGDLGVTTDWSNRHAVWVFVFRTAAGIIAGVALASLLILPGCSGGGADPFAMQSGDGSGDPFGGLGEEVSVKGFRFRPPKDLPARKMPSPAPSITMISWTQSPLDNIQSPGLVMTCAPHPMDITEVIPDWEASARAGLAAFQRIFQDVRQVTGKRMQINGLEAYRTEFTGKTKKSEAVSGVATVIVDEADMLICIAIGIGSNSADAVISLEKSIATVNKPGYVPRKDVFWDPPPGADPGPLRKTHREMIETYGLDRIAVISLIDPPFHQRSKIMDALREAAGPNALAFVNERSDECLVVVAPIDDVKRFAASVDLGQVTSIDPAERTFSLRADNKKFPTLEQEVEESIVNMRQRHSEYKAGDSGNQSRFSTPITDPNDPEFFKQNLAVLKNDYGLDREKALRQLVNADTGKVNDPEMHKQIAQAIRDVAFDDSTMPQERSLAIRGLTHWGGKFAGPILVQLLRDGPSFAEDEIYTQLAILKEPTAIDALVEKLMEPGFDGEKAAKCLVAYGSAAEDTILSDTRAEDIQTTRLIVQVLAEIGTKKSLPVLKSLRNLHFAPLIAGDLLRAEQMIQKREKGR